MTPEGGALIQATCCTLSSFNFQQVFRSGEESWRVVRALPHTTYKWNQVKKTVRAQMCCSANQETIRTFWCTSCLQEIGLWLLVSAASELNIQRCDRGTMTLSLHGVVKLDIIFSKGVQQHTLAVRGGRAGWGVIMTRGTQGCNL